MRKLFLSVALVGSLGTLACARPAAAPEATSRTVVVLAPPPVTTAPVAPNRNDAARPEGASPVARNSRDTPVARGPRCGEPPPARRTGGGLVVESPAHPQIQPPYLRLRTQVNGALGSGNRRTWAGSEVPSFVPLVTAVPGRRATSELFLLDETSDGGFFALYRDPYDTGSCTLGGTSNCSFAVALYACDGSKTWEVPLDPFFSRRDHLELQDVRYDGGVVYFNEACQSYSREAQGKCSSLVALDPKAGRVLWRTKPLTSNGQFALTPSYVVAGYGFTSEPDFVRLVRRSDGAIVDTKAVPIAPHVIDIDGDLVTATLDPGDKQVRFRIQGGDTSSAHLTPER